ncbi:hypothetical protein [Devosia sp.]|uniref:hypothetical protein n=1 Tax=Devosia sp. TaxID=1871048 RepID=UPI003A9154A3
MALLLSACSGEPGANEIKQALRSNNDLYLQMLAAAELAGVPANFDQILADSSVEKGGCSQAQGEPGFICDYRLNAVIGGQKQHGQWDKARFFNADGWQMDRVR